MLQQLATTHRINIIFLLDSFTITFNIGLFMAPRKECVQCSGLLQVQSRPISVFCERNISTACRAIELGSGADVDCCRIVRSQVAMQKMIHLGCHHHSRHIGGGCWWYLVNFHDAIVRIGKSSYCGFYLLQGMHSLVSREKCYNMSKRGDVTT